MAKTELSIAEQLNETVSTVIGEHNVQGFQKAYMIAEATSKLKTLLTPQYMKPIMELQGSKLGFKSDKVYPENVVKDCLIEAVLTGLQPHGNQFNIIAGNMYPTKEGLGYLLGNFKGLSYKIIPELPRVNANNTSAAIVMKIIWSIDGGSTSNESIEIPIKTNQYTSTDAIIGKATRKARAWLYGTITGSEIPEGDIADLDSPAHIGKTSQSPKDVSTEKEYKRISKHIDNAKTIDALEQVESILMDDDQVASFEAKKNELVFAS